MTATCSASPTRTASARRIRLVRTLVSSLALALALLLAPEAMAKDCGGTVACECGDRVVASVTLPQSLNNCLHHGLVVAAGVLDCDGRQIAGPGDRSDAVGVLVRGFTGAGASGAQVRNCRVRNFGRGIEIDSGTGNVLENNVVFNNEIGIWIGDGAADGAVLRNHVRDNRDEGIHVGTATHGHEIGWNSLVKNRGENLYMIGTNGNFVHDNTITDSGLPAILLKHSDDNLLVDNLVADRTIYVRGDSSGNVFDGNQIDSAYFRFGAIEEGSVWTYPHHNEVSGGRILKASTCFELDGAYDTTVADVAVDTCRAYEEKEVGGLVPYGNAVGVVRIDVGDPQYNGRRRTGSLRTSSSSVDRYRIDVRGIVAETPIDPATEDIQCTLTAYEGVVFDALLPAGTVRPKRRGYRYTDPEGSRGGLRRLDLRPLPGGAWRITVTGRVEMLPVEFPILTFSCRIGDDMFEYVDYWSEHSRGWNLRYQP